MRHNLFKAIFLSPLKELILILIILSHGFVKEEIAGVPGKNSKQRLDGHQPKALPVVLLKARIQR